MLGFWWQWWWERLVPYVAALAGAYRPRLPWVPSAALSRRSIEITGVVTADRTHFSPSSTLHIAQTSRPSVIPPGVSGRVRSAAGATSGCTVATRSGSWAAVSPSTGRSSAALVATTGVPFVPCCVTSVVASSADGRVVAALTML